METGNICRAGWHGSCRGGFGAKKTPHASRRAAIYDSSIQGRERSRCIPAERLSHAARKPWHIAGGAQRAKFAGSVRRWIFCGTWLEGSFFRRRTTQRGLLGSRSAGGRGDSRAGCPGDSHFGDRHRGGDRNVTANLRELRCGGRDCAKRGRLLVELIFPSHDYAFDVCTAERGRAAP